jgi:hypothetical protein
LFWVTTILVLFGACDCGSDALERIAPQIVITQTSIDFDEVTVGGSKRIYLAIKNAGTDELKITAIDSMAPFSAEVSAINIPAGGQYDLDLIFHPTVKEPVSGTLIIVSNSQGDEMTSVSLRGEGVVGYLRIEPNVLELQGVPVGSKRELEFVISNSALEAASGPLVVEAVDRPEHFELSGLPQFGVTGTYTVGSRGQLTYTLKYRPQRAGIDNGRIIFETCGERCGLEVQILASSGEAVVQFDPGVIDYGAVGIGVVKSVGLNILNNGSDIVEIYGISSPGGVFTILDSPEYPIRIEPKNRAVLTVQFEPTRAQEFQSELIIRTSDPTLKQGRVALRGVGEGALFSVQPPHLDFGIESEVGLYQRTFLLSNEGSTPVVVNEVSLVGDSVFRISGLVGLPALLDSGETLIGKVLFEPTAEAMYSARLIVKSNDVTHPEIEVPVSGRYATAACEVEMSPARVNFGLVPISYGRRKTVNVTNIGMQQCVLTSGAFGLPEDPFFTAVSSTWPISLNPGEHADFSFLYLPTQSRDAKVNFVLQTDDVQFPERLINLVGTSRANSEIFVLPPELDFGQQRPGCGKVDRQISIYNAGTVDEVISRMSIVSSSSEFSHGATSAPVTVLAGRSTLIEVSYLTQDFGVDYGDFEIEFVGKPYPFIVPMQGRGEPIPLVVEIFKQADNRKVDVLFVIDDSCSMGDEQMDLAQNFSSFINTANIRNVDFRIGVTTTDIVRFDGGLVGPVVSNTTPNYPGVFQRQAQRGVRGSGIEMGLEAMYRAIERARQGFGHNANLLRPDAGFVAVIVTDEDDQSPASSVFYLQFLRTNFAQRFQTAAIYGGRNGCVSAGAGPKIYDFISISNGTSESVCSSNWASTLSNLGAVAFGLRDRYHLNQPADTNNMIRVEVNGVVVPHTDWSYDLARDDIVFVSSAIPPESATIEVTYVPRC